MAPDDREGPAETIEVLLPWGSSASEGLEQDAALLWFGAGVALLAWTAIALLLTSW